MPSDTEIVLTGIGRFNGRDFERAAEPFDPQIEWRTGIQPLLGSEAARGREEVLAFWRETVDGFDDFRLEVLDTDEPAPGRVLVHLRYRGRGHSSGLELETTSWTVYRLEEHRIVSVQDHSTREAALAELDGA
jgi:ketosteroid isomerase-like protein